MSPPLTDENDTQGAKRRYPSYHYWDQAITSALHLKTSWITGLRSQAKNGARCRRIPFELSVDDVARLLRRCKGRCELTGSELFDRKVEGAKAGWFRPSIDRIESSGIYEYRNCRILCAAANMALGEWGEDVFAALAKGYCDSKGARIARRGALRNELDLELRALVQKPRPPRIRLPQPEDPLQQMTPEELAAS